MNEDVKQSPIVVSGTGYCVVSRPHIQVSDMLELLGLGVLMSDSLSELDRWLINVGLRIPKNFKFMGLQDKMAVFAAARALLAAKLIRANDVCGFKHSNPSMRQACGLYLAVGYIPFEYQEIAELCENSQSDGQFSMQQFSDQGVSEVNPLLTFRCLPNMPAFHVSMNFELQGPYMVGYPDAGQCYVALSRAIQDLQNGIVDIALIGGVADQNNFLVRHQLQKLGLASMPLDCAAFMILERNENAKRRDVNAGLELVATQCEYNAQDLLKRIPEYKERVRINGNSIDIGSQVYAGPASLALSIAMIDEQSDFNGEFEHSINSSGNIAAVSSWQKVRRDFDV